jgi:hypothetical protein
MYQQLWGYKVEEKLYLGVREQKRLNTTDITSALNGNLEVPVRLKAKQGYTVIRRIKKTNEYSIC